MKKVSLNAAVLLFAGLMVLTWGCVETATRFRGYTVSPWGVVKGFQDRVSHGDTLDSFEIIIGYDYTRDGDTLVISGQAALTERYPLLYSRLRDLEVYLFFIDDQSRVLETVPLARAMTGSLDETLTFSRLLAVPDAAVGIAFGYDGEVHDGGDGQFGGGSREIFSLLPRSK